MTASARTFRIFVSSTFSDLKAERSALQERVFPRLRQLCVARGCRFQAIDLRWGVSEEAALDQRTMSICLGEIARCQRISPRPNFIVLLGNRYGWLPLPHEIPAKDYEQLLPHLSHGERKLLGEWYRCDENAIPPVYCLQPRSGRYADYEEWQEVEERLHAALEAAVSKLTLFPDERRRFTASATEQEIADGALRVADAMDHVFCYFREIDGLPDDARALGFVDLDRQGRPIADSSAKLSDLKARLDRYLEGNVHRYTARWEGEGATLHHLDQLCEDVYYDLERIILAEIDLLDEIDALQSEIRAHEDFGWTRARHFIGRAEILSALKGYLQSSDDHPFSVWGESGTGKSALIAKAVQQCREDHPSAEIIFRYIGATPESSSGRALLGGLCGQVEQIYGNGKAEIPSQYKDLVEAFPRYLAKASRSKPLILFIDALDQLSEVNDARSLDWLPARLPANVKLIVSSLPGECLTALQEKLPRGNIHQIQPMSLADGETVLDLWLAEAERTLQPQQRQYVLRQFARSGLPLYLKLVFEEARHWKSYEPPPELRKDVPGMIRQLFERLSLASNHGERLVERSLGYLAAAKNGLSEDEIIDVLSQDDEVLSDFIRRSPKSPKVERLPVVLFSRLYFDLEPYLTEVSADQTTLLRFYHRQVGEVAMAEYLHGEQTTERHRALAAYFGQQDVSVRKVEELPWHLAKSANWRQLADLMGDWFFFEFAWNRDRFAVERYWAQVEANSPLRMTEVYSSILERHGDKLDHIGNVAHLLDETFHKEEAAALRAHLLEQQRGQANPYDLVEALNARGVSLKNAGDREGAMQVYKEAEVILRNLGDRRMLATVLGNQGNVFRQLKDYDQALAVLEEALQISRELGDQYGMTGSLNALALVHYEREEYSKALPYLEEQERICRQTGERMGLAAALGNRASILSSQGDTELGVLIDLRRQEAEIYRELGIRPKLEECLASQANLLHQRAQALYTETAFKPDAGKRGQVIALYMEEEKIWNEINRVERVLLAQSDRAVVMASLGQREARALVEGAYRQAISSNLPEVANKIQRAMSVVFSMVD
jgi:tetratricopeptide (TPR) repeat protein